MPKVVITVCERSLTPFMSAGSKNHQSLLIFLLANYDNQDLSGVIAPFGSGCSSIVYNPLRQLQSENPRAVLVMFDISACPYVPSETLTIAIPWTKFLRMVDNMKESFLIIGSWEKIRQRLST